MLRLANCRLPRYFRPCSTGLSAPRACVGDFLVRGRVALKTRREVRRRELDFPGRGNVQNETARRPHPLEITGLTLYLVNGVRLARPRKLGNERRNCGPALRSAARPLFPAGFDLLIVSRLASLILR